jgi:hypothetical protein
MTGTGGLREEKVQQSDAADRTTEGGLARRLLRPTWLTPSSVTFTVTTISAACYVVTYALDAAFLGEFGTSPEEVGISQATLLMRAAMFGCLLLFVGCLLASAVALVVAVISRAEGGRLERWPTSASPRESAAARSRSIQQRTLAIAITCGLAVTLAGTSLGVLGDFEGEDGGMPLIFLCLSTFTIYGLARYRHAVALVMSAVWAVALAVVGMTEMGAQIANSVQTDGPRQDVQLPSWWFLTGLQVGIVCPDWVDDGGPKNSPERLIYLGRTGSVSLLSDGERLFRVPDQELDALVTPLTSDAMAACAVS